MYWQSVGFQKIIIQKLLIFLCKIWGIFCAIICNWKFFLLLVKIAENVVIWTLWIADYAEGVATFSPTAQILGAVFMPLPQQRLAFLYLISTYIYLLIKLGAVIAPVKVSSNDLGCEVSSLVIEGSFRWLSNELVKGLGGARSHSAGWPVNTTS